MTNQGKHHMQGGLQMANGRNQSELEDPNTVKPLLTKEEVIENLKNLGLHQISARKDLLNIDTTYQIDANTTETFLPPNFYIDRIVDYITANYTPTSEVEERERLARINELEPLRDAFADVGGHDALVAILDNRIAELTKESAKRL